jgi:hypothetical protein
MNWLMLRKLEHREQRIVLEKFLGAVRQESERVEHLEQATASAGDRLATRAPASRVCEQA